MPAPSGGGLARERAPEPLQATVRAAVASAAALGLTEAALRPGGEPMAGGPADPLLAQAMQRRLAALDAPRLSTALDWLRDYVTAYGRSPLFVTPSAEGDLQAMVYNQETLDSFGEYVRAPRGTPYVRARTALRAPRPAAAQPKAPTQTGLEDGPGADGPISRSERSSKEQSRFCMLLVSRKLGFLGIPCRFSVRPLAPCALGRAL